MTFQPGELVSLISSGLPMTVESVEGDNVTVVRQDAKGKTFREKFKVAALKKFQRPRPMTFRL